MKITKRQLRRIIREEKEKVLSEVTPTPEQMVRVEFDDDFHQLIATLEEAVTQAQEMAVKMKNVEYVQYAGGREADDLESALRNVWTAFGGRSLTAEGFDEPL